MSVAASSAALFSSEYQCWLTPKPVVECLERMGGVALDPCGNRDSIVGAKRQYLIERGEDGLALPWDDLGLNFSNPEFDEADAWCRKVLREVTERGCEVVLLLPARTDTVRYQELLLPNASALHFWRGRMDFGKGLRPALQGELFGGHQEALATGDNGSTFAVALTYFGNEPHSFLRAFAPHGWGVVCR